MLYPYYESTRIQAAERLATFQAEARHATTVRQLREPQSPNYREANTLRRRFGLLLISWGNRLMQV